MAEEKKKTTKKKATEEVKADKVETKKTTKKAVKDVAAESNALVVAEEKKTPKRKVSTKKKEETPVGEEKTKVKKTTRKKEEVVEVKEEKKKAKVVGYNSQTGVPVYDDPDGEKPVKFDIKTGKPIYKDDIKEEVPVKAEPVKEPAHVVTEPEVENVVVPVVAKEPVAEVVPVVAAPVGENPPVKEEPSSGVTQTITVDRSTLKSEFDGKLLQLIGWYLLGLLVSIVTLGLGAPFAKCFILNWQYKHTKINGRRLCFDGNGFQLLGNYIKWTFFTIITLGIYLIFLPVAWNKWVVKHTHYEGNKKPVVNYSLFDGTTWDLIGLSILTFFLNLFSLGLLSPFTETLLYSWRINHTTYDTIDMEFDGKGFQLLGNYIKWTFFTIITLGIYGLWVPIKRIKWEVKHTNEKGFSKHPYKPILGMILPCIFAVLCLSGGIFGLTRIDKDTWSDLVKDVNHFANSIDKEVEKYDLGHVLVERFGDLVYRIKTEDMNITWDERYRRFFEPDWYDKLSDNDFSRVFTGEVEMAVLDVDDVDTPVIIAEYDDMYRIFWLFEKKIENHFYYNQDENSGLYLAVDEDGVEHLAVIDKKDDGLYRLVYVYDTINYDDKDIVYGYDYDTFMERVKKKNITLKPLDVHYTTVDVDNMDGYEEMVEYYYKHTDKVYDVGEEIKEKNYYDEYLDYLKENASGEYSVTVLDDYISDNTVLVVFEKNKSYVLSYNKGVVVNSINAKGYIGLLKTTSDDKREYVIVVTDGKYKIYYFVRTMLSEGTPKQIKVKSNNLTKALREKGYKEAREDFKSVNISNDEDLTKLEDLLKN